MRCPFCHKYNYLTPIDNYAVEADAIKCYYCSKTFWIDPNYFSDALDEAIITQGRATDLRSVAGEEEEGDSYKNKKTTAKQLEIRKAIEEDFEDLYNIYIETNKSNCLDKNVNYSKSELRSYLPSLYVGVSEGHTSPVGFFLIFDMGVWGYLDIFCISPASKKQGFGSRMVEFLDRMAEDKSWRLINTLIEPQNFKSAAFFEGKGFSCYGAMLYQSKLYREKNDQEIYV